MPTCNGLDTGSRFARLEREQTSGTVLNHGKRSGVNNCTGVDDVSFMVLTAVQAMKIVFQKARIVKSVEIYIFLAGV